MTLPYLSSNTLGDTNEPGATYTSETSHLLSENFS